MLLADSFKNWLCISEIQDFRAKIAEALLERPLFEARRLKSIDPNATFAGEMNGLFTTPVAAGGLGFPPGDWAGHIMKVISRASHLRGQDLQDLTSDVISRFIEAMKGLQHRDAAAGVGGGMSDETASHIKGMAAAGDAEGLMKWMTQHAKQQARSIADYMSNNPSWRSELPNTNAAGGAFDKDNDDYAPIALPSRKDPADEYKWFAQAVVADLEKSAQTGGGPSRENYMLAAQVAAEILKDPEHPINQREIVGLFVAKGLKLARVNTEIMPRVKQAVLAVAQKYGNPTAQAIAAKISQSMSSGAAAADGDEAS